ncbi:hypothetical protein PV341_17200 [Streptomyces sp. PA03-1a]|nr:hypothetical protein [Streptomyces sp. PA03-1a]MDX2814527.1 hypothetical protein [Streptomyces sp. PA03-5A]
MSDQYKVDLSELEDTITKLNGVISQLGVANVCAKNDTYLPPGALGAGFDEAEKLARAHEDMKTHIESVVAYIHRVMNDFGSKTKKVHGHYSDAEYDAQSGMSGSGKG